ncbi:hypothetical protein [Acidovorax carolinensis]|uniref:hypothetical protein n=1 Tax=Acidovorax carolinensis TaxID=553814 RepID=UPI0012FF69F8|nr:hypothetical protein [Acidovorax carolinensis]
MGKTAKDFCDGSVAETQSLRIESGVHGGRFKKSSHVICDLRVQRDAGRSCQQLRESQHIIDVLANVFGVNMLAPTEN